MFSACDRPESHPEWASVNVDLRTEWSLAGVEVVDPLSVPEAATLVQFDSQSRSTDQLLSVVNIADMSFDDDDLLAILDRDSMRLVLVETDSTHRPPIVVDLDSLGEGRFVGHDPTSLEVLSQGRGVEVVDVAAWWSATFGLDGDFRSARRVPQPPLFGQRYDVRVTSSGDLFQLGYDQFQESLQEALGERLRGQVVGQNTLQRLSRERRHAEWVDLREVPGLEVVADQSTGTIKDLPFASGPLWGVGIDDGLWFAWSRSGLVVALNPDGSVRCALELRIDPVRTSDREASDFYGAIDLRDDQTDRTDRARYDRARLPFPPYRPLLRSLTTGPDNGVLVVWEGMVDDRPVIRAIRLTRDCEAHYQFDIGTGFRPYRSATDWVLGAYRDALGFERALLLSVRGM